jgi:NADH-quinone oxidoreductase subunit B
MLIEGIMAIQKIIDNDNLPRDPEGKRLPLQLAVQPNFQPTPQPVDVSIGAS